MVSRTLHASAVAVLLVASCQFSVKGADDDIVINEIHYNPDGQDERTEFIELFNTGVDAVSLDGWRFTRGVSFTFSAEVVVEAGGYVVVARDLERFRRAWQTPGIASFGDFTGALKNSGERLVLENAAGEQIEDLRYSDRPPYPTRADGDGPTLERRSPVTNNDLAYNWRAGTSSWIFVESPIVLNSSRFSLFLRDAGEVLVDEFSLTLADSDEPLIPDGGFEFGIDGWTFDVSHRDSRHETGDGYSGTGALRLVATRAGDASSSSFEITPTLPKGTAVHVSFRIKLAHGSTTVDFGENGSLRGPLAFFGTPGSVNTVFIDALPPGIELVDHEPRRPTSTEAVTLRAIVSHQKDVAGVRAIVHDGESETVVELRDDGSPGDEAAGDGLWTGRLSPRPDGTIVRYRIVATDAGGAEGHFPIPGEPTRSRAYCVNDAAVESAVPVFEWIIPPEHLAVLASRTAIYQAGTLIFDGEVYDLGLDSDGTSVQDTLASSNSGRDGFRHRGSNSLGPPKKPWKVRFPKDHLFDRGDAERFGASRRKINFNTFWTNKDCLREHLAHRAFEDLGSPNCYSELVRIVLNASFYGLYLHLEHPDEDFLERNGLNRSGELWKSNENGNASSGSLANYEKETAPELGDLALSDFIRSLPRGSDDTPKREFVDERIDVERFRDYLVTTALLSNADQPHKNHYMFHDPETGLWTQTPWDLDLTWGQNHECEDSCRGGSLPSGGTGRDCIRWENHILLGTRRHKKCDDKWNYMTDVFLVSEKHNGVFRDRIEALATAYLTNENLDPIIEDLRERIRAEVSLDRERWGSWGNPITWDFDERIDELKAWITLRREFLLDSLPEPITDFSCTVHGRVLELAWEATGAFRNFVVRVGPAGTEWGETLKSVKGSTRSTLIELEPAIRGELEVRLSGQGTNHIYTPGVSCLVSVEPLTFLRADVSADGKVNLADAIALLTFLFDTSDMLPCVAAADIEGDGILRVTDPIILINYLFFAGPPPRAPFPECGPDGDPEPLPCSDSGFCAPSE